MTGRAVEKDRTAREIEQSNLHLCKQSESTGNDFKHKDAVKSRVGKKRGQSVEKIQKDALLVKEILIGNQTAEHGFADGKIAVYIIPVVERVPKGRARA